MIIVRNRWEELADCLRQLKAQVAPPDFEVVVVDDGSTIPPPKTILHCSFLRPLRYIRQIPLGIAAARNRGLQVAAGELVLFVDSDCLVATDCLAALVDASANHPEDVAFQLALAGSHSYLGGCMEDLKLRAILQQKLQPDEHVEYANTSGFAVRKSYASAKEDLFEVGVVRGEDTLALARILADGLMPRFVPGARVLHQPRLPLLRYLLKQFGVGYHVSVVRCILLKENRVLMSGGRKFQMLGRMLRLVGPSPRMGFALWVTLVAAGIESLGRSCFRLFGYMPGPMQFAGLKLDRISPSKLKWLIISAAQGRKPLTLACVPANTVKSAAANSDLPSELRRFDLCCVGSLCPTPASKLRGIPTAVSSSFLHDLCQESQYRNLTVGFVGSDPEVVGRFRIALAGRLPSLAVRFFAFTDSAMAAVTDLSPVDTKAAEPSLLFVEMITFHSEGVAHRLRKLFPRSAVVCAPVVFTSQPAVGATPCLA